MDISGGLRLIFFLGVIVSTLILLIFLLDLLLLDIFPLRLFLMYLLLSSLPFLASLYDRSLVSLHLPFPFLFLFSLHFSFLLGGRAFLLGLGVVDVEDGQVADVGGQGDLEEVASVRRQDLVGGIVKETGGRPDGRDGSDGRLL